jgi:MFS family permease
MSSQRRLLLAVLCGVLFLDGLDVSLVGVALPSIKSDLGLSDAQLQWVVSAYVLGYGGFLLLGGRTADLAGRRRTLLVALGVFAVASVIGGLVSDPNLLLAARFLKGASAAFSAPAGLSIITTAFAEGPERNRAVSLYAATGASGFSLGLVVGGLTTEAGWRLALILPGPVAALLFMAALRAVPRDRPRLHYATRFDLPGAITLTGAMLLLVRTIVEASSSGSSSAATIVGFVASAALMAAFVGVERRSSSPLLRLGLLRSSGIARASVGIVTLFGAYVGFQFVLTLYLQTTNHWSPIRTALAFLPVGVLIALGATQVGPVMHRVGPARLIALGFVPMAVGYLLLLRIGGTPQWATVLLPTTLLVGIGIGLAFPALNVLATNGIAPHEQGIAAAVFQASNQIGAALVLAIVTAVVTAHGAAGSGSAVPLGAYRDGLDVVAAVAIAGLLIALAALVPLRRARGSELGAEPSA